MKKTITLILSAFQFLTIHSQELIGISPIGIEKENSTTNNHSVINPYVNYSSFIQGESSMSSTGNYFLKKSGSPTNKDTIIIINSANGNISEKDTISQNHLTNFEYSNNNNSLFGLSPIGLYKFNLSDKSYTLINPAINYNGVYNGVSTYNQTNDDYYFVKSGTPDTLFCVNVNSGSIVSKDTLSNFKIYNIEFNSNDNCIYTLASIGFSKFNTQTKSYTILNSNLNSGYAYNGLSTFDKNLNEYIFVKNGMGAKDTIFKINISNLNLTKDTVMQNHFQLIEYIDNTMTGINVRGTKTTLEFYPNPTNDIVKFKNLNTENKIIIFDNNGKIVLTNENISEINLNSLTSGTYFIKISSNNQNYTIKVLKQ